MASPCISPEGLSVRTDRYWPSGDNRGLLTRERLAKALTGRSRAVAPEAGVAGSDVDATAMPQAQADASSAETASFRANMRPSPIASRAKDSSSFPARHRNSEATRSGLPGR